MRIAVVGNCHGGIVAQTVRTALRDVAGLDCRHIVSYQHAGEAERDFVDAADRVLLQVTDFRSSSDLAGRIDTTSDRVGLFPLIAANFLYPFAGKAHPRAAESRSFYCPSGYYEGQVSDSVLLDLMQQHPEAPAGEIADRYLALDYATLTDLDRLHEVNRLKMQRIGAAAGLDLWARVERGFRDAPFFWTYLHPSGALLRPLCAHALRQLRLGLDAESVQAAVDGVIEPLGFAHMPIHPSVVRHFGIEWATPEYRYRFMPEGAFTIRQFAMRYVGFDHDDELTRAIFDLHNDRAPESVVETLERAAARHIGNGDVLINLAIAYWKRGLLAKAMQAAISALRIDPKQSEWSTFLGIVVEQALHDPARAFAAA
jgi:hypothetical protein